MKNTFLKKLGVTALAVTIIAIGTSSFTSADESRVRNTPKFPEQHEKIVEVMKAGDYDAWVALLSECGQNTEALEKINKDNFPKFVEAFNLRQQGLLKMLEAREILEELGIDKMGKRGNKSGRRGNGNRDGQGQENSNRMSKR